MKQLFVIYGDDAKGMTTKLLEAISPAPGLGKDASIALKPNLVVAKPWTSGATTNPAVCEAVIEYFMERGYKRISIIESAWVGEDTQRAFRVCGYDKLAKKYGVELVDVTKDEYETREFGGMRIKISRRALQTDFLVNLPLIKGHCQTVMTCALKNMKGLIPHSEKRRFHTLGLHQPIACLNGMIHPSLTIADGIYTDPGFEEGGNPVRGNVMVAGDDSVMIDAFAAKRLGLRARDVGYIRLAEQLGLGSADIGEIVELGGTQTELPADIGLTDAVKSHIIERSACSACYANLAGALSKLPDIPEDLKVCIGQGFRGQSGDLGCGNCTSRFQHCIKGCPPSVDDIYKYLQKSGR